ncbi:hypothetical protein [Vibrio mytili]|uniref:Uncharacterized protein n=1 Tax=Vibrio mytili TaxID=50718 RepID=A0A0C3DEV1_9VIBR|nr:hypothetical protein [Vibrio mytili]KIN09899.1 hypothetical protein SU60_16245 [Vibrio mytili]
MLNRIPSVSDSFNAKTSTTEDLCETFITNEFYDKLACPNHCIMIGPRGSGKTTLMRMLDIESLELWTSEKASEYRKTINYSGVFIPTDRYWKTQYQKIENKLKDDEISKKEKLRYDTAIILLEQLFSYHVFENLLSVVNYRCSRTIKKKNNFKNVELTKESEVELVFSLKSILNVEPRINSLKSLLAEVILKKQLISNAVNNLISNDDVDVQKVGDFDLISNLESVVAIVNTYFEEKSGKWAFLFDELELAPNQIIKPLVNEMRGGHKDIIFKLALSPYHKGVSITDDTDSAMKAQDIELIDLTGLSDNGGNNFANSLCTALFQRKGLYNNIEHYFEEPKDINIDKDFSDLSAKDPSFNNYLIERGFKSDIYTNQDSQLRKIKFIVHLRNFKRSKDGKKHARRRPADYYGGFENICKAVEYNPRMLIGLMNKFISHAKEGKVSLNQQLISLQEYFHDYRSLLGTIAVDSGDNKFNNIYDLISEIAQFFRDEIHGPQFKTQPKGSIAIKSKISDELNEIIGYALNAGALIPIDTEIGSLNDLNSSKRCRLSYIFSHHYDLLMTKQSEIDIVELINQTKLKSTRLKIVDLLGFTNYQQYSLELE